MFKLNTYRLKEKIFLAGIIFLSIVFLTEVTSAQSFGSIKKGVQINVPQKTYKTVLDPLPAGTYTIGTGGYFTTIQAAFNKLSEDGIAGPVTLELIDNLYVAPTDSFGFLLNGPIAGTNTTNRVTIKPATNKNVVIQGSGLITISLFNTSYVNFNGIETSGATTLTILTNHNSAFSFNDGIDICNNSDHNVMQNIIFINEDYTRQSGSGFMCWENSTGAPDSNLIQNNLTKQAGIAYYFDCYYASIRPDGNIIRGNKIGSDTDSLINKGIVNFKCLNSVIEDNTIQNLRITSGWSENDTFQVGIYSYYGINEIIRNNKIYNLKSNAGFTCSGIIIGGWENETGVHNQAYNNMVFDIQSTSNQYDNHIGGIQIFYNNYSKIYYNTVYLTGTGTNKLGSAALYLWYNCQNTEVKDNIFINARNESIYCASSICEFISNTLTSNNNDLYYNPNEYNCLVKKGSTDYHSLADWQVTGNDLNSITEIPNFVSANDLHINTLIPTNIESHGTPIAGIDTDFDGDLRSTTSTDIGADEFNGIVVGIDGEQDLPTEFALNQNYPNPFNPSTKISWQAPVSGWQTIKVFNSLGQEVETIIDGYYEAGVHSKLFSVNSSLSSGVYFYQLKAGEYLQTRKMILLK